MRALGKIEKGDKKRRNQEAEERERGRLPREGNGKDFSLIFLGLPFIFSYFSFLVLFRGADFSDVRHGSVHKRTKVPLTFWDR